MPQFFSLYDDVVFQLPLGVSKKMIWGGDPPLGEGITMCFLL